LKDWREIRGSGRKERGKKKKSSPEINRLLYRAPTLDY